jgi:hypothetical protein
VSVFATAVLGAVFVWAGTAKLVHGDQFMVFLRQLGLRWGTAVVASRAVAVWELALAAVLLAAPTAALGQVLALATLSVFTVGLLLARARGADTDCGCFGSPSGLAEGAQGSRNSIVRNMVLLVPATLALVGGSPAGNPLPAELSGLTAVLGVALIVSVRRLARMEAPAPASAQTESTPPAERDP